MRFNLLAVTAAAAAAVALPDGIPSHFADFAKPAGDSDVYAKGSVDYDHIGLGANMSANILGRRADQAFVSGNGWVTFGSRRNELGPQPHAPPFQLPWSLRRSDGTADPSIGVIWGDLDLRAPNPPRDYSPNTAFFRVVGKDKAPALARAGLLPPGFTPTRALVATWYAARCYPATSSESMKRAVTAQLVLFADGTDPRPSCTTESCLGRTVAVWRYHGLTVPNSTFGAGVDSGLQKTGALCYATEEDPSLDRDQCDVALLPFFAMRKAPKKLAAGSMTTAWGTKLNAGEYAYRLDRPLGAAAPAKRGSVPRQDPSVPERLRNVLPPGTFAPFGPAAGDKSMAACSGECFSTGADLSFRANILGNKPSHPRISNRGYVEFSGMSWQNNPYPPGLGPVPKAPPFRAAVTDDDGDVEAPAVFAALWGNFDTSVVDYSGTAPRPNTVYFRQAGRREAARLAGPVADEITELTGALVVTWYRLSDNPTPAPAEQRSFASSQLVLLMNGTMYTLARIILSPRSMGRTVAIFRYDSGAYVSTWTGSGMSGGQGDTKMMCRAEQEGDYRVDPDQCDGFTLPDFGTADLAYTLERVRQARVDGTLRVAGEFAFRLDRAAYSAAKKAPVAPKPEPVAPTDTPATLPPVTDPPAAACAAAAGAPPVTNILDLRPALRITTLDRSPYAMASDAAALMCLLKGTTLKAVNSRFLGRTAGGVAQWAADLRVSSCSGHTCMEDNYGRMKVFADAPLGPEAAKLGLVAAVYHDVSTPLAPKAPVPDPSKPAPTPDASCATPAPLGGSPDPGLVLAFGGQPSLDIVDALLPHLCLPAGSRIEVTPAARGASGGITLNASLGVCAGHVVDRTVTAGCPALAAASMKAFAANVPAAAKELGVTGAVFVTDITKTADAAGDTDKPPLDCSATFAPLTVEAPRLVLQSWREPTAGLRDDVAALLCLGPGTSLSIRSADAAATRRAAAAAALGGGAASTATFQAVIEVEQCGGVANATVPGFAGCAADVAARMDALVTAAPRSNAALAVGIVSIALDYDVPALPVAPEPTAVVPATATGASKKGFFSNPAAVAGVAVGGVGLVVAVAAAVLVVVSITRRGAARVALPVTEAEPVREQPVMGEVAAVNVKQVQDVPEVGFLDNQLPKVLPQPTVSAAPRAPGAISVENHAFTV